MTTRTVVEWRCERCGTEAAIPDGKAHGWCNIGTIHRSEIWRNNRFSSVKQDLPKIGGDLCPECAKSLLAWWQRQKETVA